MPVKPEYTMQPVESEEALRELLEPLPRGLWFLDLLERYVPLKRWGFRPSRANGLHIVYDSSQCRVSFSPVFERWEPDQGSVFVLYGRLHAPDGQTDLEWQGERCVSWHSISDPEFYWFLEGASPKELAELQGLRSKFPAREAFKATGPGSSLHGVEWSTAFAGFEWDYYGERLFSLSGPSSTPSGVHPHSNSCHRA